MKPFSQAFVLIILGALMLVISLLTKKTEMITSSVVVIIIGILGMIIDRWPKR